MGRLHEHAVGVWMVYLLDSHQSGLSSTNAALSARRRGQLSWLNDQICLAQFVAAGFLAHPRFQSYSRSNLSPAHNCTLEGWESRQATGSASASFASVLLPRAPENLGLLRLHLSGRLAWLILAVLFLLLMAWKRGETVTEQKTGLLNPF